MTQLGSLGGQCFVLLALRITFTSATCGVFKHPGTVRLNCHGELLLRVSTAASPERVRDWSSVLSPPFAELYSSFQSAGVQHRGLLRRRKQGHPQNQHYPGQNLGVCNESSKTCRKQLTPTKEKSGQVLAGTGPPTPSAESLSVLEQSRLALLKSRDDSGGSVVEAGSVCEEKEDSRLLAACFLVEGPLLFSEEGESGTKLETGTSDTQSGKPV